MSVYRRTELAATLTQRLLRPGVLDEGLRSGLFLSGLRRTGKTTFLVHDLIPALEARGALVVYVDLWSDVHASPSDLVHAALRRTLHELQTPRSALLARLKRLTGADVEALGFKFGFSLEAVGEEGGPTLAQALTEVVDRVRTDVVLLVDEVQQALGTDEGQRLLLALKAARDAINARPATPGRFLFVGTGSHQSLVHELTTRKNQAFAGATALRFPVLDADYVAWVIDRLKLEGADVLPGPEAAADAFEKLGHRPEELIKALRLLQTQVPARGDPDTVLGVIASTLRAASADVELARLDRLGGLAAAIFDRIARSEQGGRGLYSAEAAAEYGAALGREVRVEEIQPVVNELLAGNLILRRAHGVYAVTDPFVQETWGQRKRLTAAP